MSGLIFFPHGNSLLSYVTSASVASSAQFLANFASASVTASVAATQGRGPSGSSGSSVIVTGSKGPTGIQGPSGSRGLGIYLLSSSRALCGDGSCVPFSSFCIGVNQYTYNEDCSVYSLSCINYVACGGANSECV